LSIKSGKAGLARFPFQPRISRILFFYPIRVIRGFFLFLVGVFKIPGPILSDSAFRIFPLSFQPSALAGWRKSIFALDRSR
jgi:hypothetical protein